ncbi:MAG: hypothetical protein IT364_24585 [Candidatus Hydrogenedentes bacterium]|nr:hypothetical protein [Candidatus Hydrogenedentota bacterium]
MFGTTAVRKPNELTERQLAQMLEDYYINNSLYTNLLEFFRGENLWTPNMAALRNPTYAVVEFYAMTLWPGPLPDALPIVTEHDAIVEPIKQIWQWSNWGVKKQVAARKYAMIGDLFVKVATRDRERVYLQVIDGKNVSDFDVDERGFITWLRYEVQCLRRGADGRNEPYTHTEVWDRERYRLWEHTRGFDAELDRLGNPSTESALGELVPGLDFVPWVHAPFRDIGDKRGMPAIWPAIDKIDECNRKGTRLAELMFMFNKPHLATKANAVAPDGRPLPAPTFKLSGEKKSDTDRLSIGDMEVWQCPGNSSVDFLIPDLNWQSHRDQITDDLAEIARDLPEVRYYDLMESGDVSGRALLLKMGPAIMRVLESRGNAETAIIRAHQMALTIGKSLGISGFAGVGDYKKGDFEHTFKSRDVIPLTDDDRGNTAKVFVDMGVPLGQSLQRYAGWTAEQADALDARAADLKSPEQQAAEQEAIVAAASQKIGPIVQQALETISTGAIDALVKSGALERMTIAKGNGSATA